MNEPVTLTFPLPPAVLTSNERSRSASKYARRGAGGESERAATVRVRAETAILTRVQLDYRVTVFTVPVGMSLHFRVGARDRRDLLALAECVKPLIDGLVDAGLLLNDTPRWLPCAALTWERVTSAAAGVEVMLAPIERATVAA